MLNFIVSAIFCHRFVSLTGFLSLFGCRVVSVVVAGLQSLYAKTSARVVQNGLMAITSLTRYHAGNRSRLGQDGACAGECMLARAAM